MVAARRALAVLLMLMGLGGLAADLGPVGASGHGAYAAELTVDGAIEQTTARFLSRGLAAAAEEGAHLLILIVDTPGGIFDATRDMVEDILASEVPVVAYVSPGGAQAASAGTFLVAAAHVAAMAPGTNIGAAAPVGPTGDDLPETMKSKATQDAAAFIRSIAEKRGREPAPLEQTVLTAKSFSHSEALDAGIIDLTVASVEELLSRLDGTPIYLDSGARVVLETQGIRIEPIERNAVEKFLGVLANPNIAFLLLTIGGLGIVIELFNPGTIVPGLVGVILLALAFVALGNLPVNWAGVGLIALAMLLFFAELQAPGTSVFGVGGVISFLLGGFLLFGGFSPPPIETPSFRVSFWMIGAVSALLLASLVVLFRMTAQAKRLAYPQRVDEIVGSRGTVVRALDPKGTVQVSSENWSAVSDSGESIPEGEEIIVAEVDGLTLKVLEASKINERTGG